MSNRTSGQAVSLLMQFDYLLFPNGRKIGFHSYKQLTIPHSFVAPLPAEHCFCLVIKSAHSFFLHCSRSLGSCSLLLLPNTSQPLSLDLGFSPKPAQIPRSQWSPLNNGNSPLPKKSLRPKSLKPSFTLLFLTPVTQPMSKPYRVSFQNMYQPEPRLTSLAISNQAKPPRSHQITTEASPSPLLFHLLTHTCNLYFTLKHFRKKYTHTHTGEREKVQIS